MLGWLGLGCENREVEFVTFVSQCSPSLSTSAPPLTVKNVCEVVQGVEWTVLGARLIGSLKCDEIGQIRYISVEDRIRLVIEYWLAGGDIDSGKPSWRLLISNLDYANLTETADNIRHFAEAVLGKSCNSISVSTFLYSDKSFLT